MSLIDMVWDLFAAGWREQKSYQMLKFESERKKRRRRMWGCAKNVGKRQEQV